MKRKEALDKAIIIVTEWYKHYSGPQKGIKQIMEIIDKVADDIQTYVKTGRMKYCDELNEISMY